MSRVISLKKTLRYGMAVTAGICLVVAIVKTYQFLELSPDSLYNEVFVNYQLRDSGNTLSRVNGTIENLYLKKNFAAIIKESKKPRLPDDETFLLIGISYLHTNDAFNAIAALRQIKHSGDYFQTAQYYLALAYLKNNDYDQALGLMQQIKNDKSHPYYNYFSSSFLKRVRMVKWK